MGILYIVSTPIGNLEDLSPRARKTLEMVDIILCEDSRRTGLLLKTRAKLLSYYDQIEDKRIPEVIDLLTTNNVALVSDAGTPILSDPGYRLVRECLKRHINVVSIPGPSAVLAALTSSGLPPDKFTFLGYVHPKNFSFVQLGVTAIFFSAPHKLVQDLASLKEKFGDIEIVIARELTKIHEEIWKGKISVALTHFKNPKGEFVLLFNIPRV